MKCTIAMGVNCRACRVISGVWRAALAPWKNLRSPGRRLRPRRVVAPRKRARRCERRASIFLAVALDACNEYLPKAELFWPRPSSSLSTISSLTLFPVSARWNIFLDPGAALLEMARVAKPNACFYFWCPMRFFTPAVRALFRHASGKVREDVRSLREWQQLFDSAGLELSIAGVTCMWSRQSGFSLGRGITGRCARRKHWRCRFGRSPGNIRFIICVNSNLSFLSDGHSGRHVELSAAPRRHRKSHR